MIHKTRTNSLFLLLILFPLLVSQGQDFRLEKADVRTSDPVVLLEKRVPTCLDRDEDEIPDSEYHWLHLPFQASELRTSVPYVFLAGRLIQEGVVDASECPAGGLLRSGASNTCGLEKALTLVIEMQNMYDDEILNAGYQIGVPPVMLKQQFRYESQFWPGQHDEFHFGLGHLTAYGASTALLWSYDIYREVCQSIFGAPCAGPYRQTRNVYEDIFVGTLLSFVNADCPTCPQKIDYDKAEASVRLFALIDLAHCYQASQILYNITGRHSRNSVDYATIWKLALFNYNAGPGCLYEAAKTTLGNRVVLRWDEFVENVSGKSCLVGVDYVESVTGRFYDFTPAP
jgi:hypothetical protein